MKKYKLGLAWEMVIDLISGIVAGVLFYGNLHIDE
jgi:proton glutamate symport protein